MAKNGIIETRISLKVGADVSQRFFRNLFQEKLRLTRYFVAKDTAVCINMCLARVICVQTLTTSEIVKVCAGAYAFYTAVYYTCGIEYLCLHLSLQSEWRLNGWILYSRATAT